MPTPFMHLEIAELIRSNPGLRESVKENLEREFDAFYLGSVAPDLQSTAGLRREETHFYNLPPDPDEMPYERMLRAYPQISNTSTMAPNHAWFIAGYCAHLLLDLKWYQEVLIPFFLEEQSWANHRQAFLVHNTLLTYLDKSAVETLPAYAPRILAAAQPKNWLPFAVDSDLVKWRNQLVEQLEPGAMLQTVEVYAHRLGMSAKEFAANLDRPEWMNRHLFSKVPVSEVEAILHSSVEASVDLIENYVSVN